MSLPCIMLPAAAGPDPVGRDDVLDSIEKHLRQGSSSSFRSVVLHGGAGVGKTHTAVDYARALSSAGKLSAVLWVAAESKAKLQKSFTDIAAKLQLPAYNPKKHDNNRSLGLAPANRYVSLLSPTSLLVEIDN